MDIQSFVSEHGTLTLVLLFIIVIYIGYTLYWFYSRRYWQQYWKGSQKKCLNKETQHKIANDIKRKLKEIDSCDCKDTCKLNVKNTHRTVSPMSTESARYSDSPDSSMSEFVKSIKSAKPEKFGNYDFY